MAEHPPEERLGRRALAPLAIVLITMLTISVALAAWLTINGLNTQAREQAEAEAEREGKRTTTAITIESVSANLVNLRNSGRGRINDVAVYLDGVPINLVENFRGLGEKETGVLEMEVAPTFGEHRLKVVANSIAQDEVRLSGRSLGIFKARIPIRVTNPANRDYKATWAFGGGTSGGKAIEVSLPISDGGAIVATPEGLEYPSKITTNWYNSAWKKRKEISLSDFTGRGYYGNLVEVALEGLTLSTGKCSELRIATDSGSLVPYETTVQDGSTCKVRFPAEVPPGTQAKYYAYFSNPSGEALGLEAEIRNSSTSDRTCFDNGKVSVCFGTSKGGILNISESGKGNLLAENSGPEGKYSGVAPSVFYKEGWDYNSAACPGTYSYINHSVRKGAVSTKVDYYFSISCSGNSTYVYRYVATFYPNTQFYDLETHNANEVRFGGITQNFFSQVNWNKSFPSEGSVVSDGKYAAYWREGMPEETGIGVVALSLSDKAIGGFLRPPSFIVLDDSKSLPPGLISNVRTVVSKSENGAEPTESEHIRTLPESLGITVGPDETPASNSVAKVDFSVYIDKGASKSVYLYYTDSELVRSRDKPSHSNSLVGYGLEGAVGKEEILN